MNEPTSFRVVVRVPSPAEYAALRRSVGWTVPTHEESEAALGHTVVAVCAEAGDDTIGMARVVGDWTFYWYLQDLVVRPDWQHRGVGRALVRAVEENVASLSPRPTSLGLVTGAEEVGFYQRIGYSVENHYMSRSVGG